MSNLDPKYRFKPGNQAAKGNTRRMTPEEKKAVNHVKEALWIVAVSTPEKVDKLWKDPTYGQMVAVKLAVRAAKHGNVAAIKEFNDRILHRAPQAITGADGAPLTPETDKPSPFAGMPMSMLGRLLTQLEKEDEGGEE